MDQEWKDEQQELEEKRVETKRETDKKCPSCGGTMDFDPITGGLACPYCGHTQAIEPVDETNVSAQEQDFSTAEQTGNCNWGAEKKTVICNSCGAESIYDALDIAGECPYCGSNQVMEAKGVNTLAPGGVCVFKVTQDKAAANFKSWLGKKLFCPKAAKESCKAKSFQGVYLPYWTFDAQTASQFKAEYNVPTTSRDREGKTVKTDHWYPVSGKYLEFIDDQPVMASTRHNASMLKQLEPFHTADNLAYKPEYVAGFVSERYSIGLKDAWERGKQIIRGRLDKNIRKQISSDKHAEGVRNLNFSTLYSSVKYKYLLLPVWISCFQYNGKTFQFMVNGQTGKVAGKSPISALRVTIAVVIGLVALGILAWLAGD